MTNESRLGQLGRYLYAVAGLPSDYLETSQSQYGQDMLVLRLLGARRDAGFFVEFGAIDGVLNSNSHYLEKSLGWRGIVSEPSRRWHEALRRNRACHVDTRCVYSRTGERVEFGDTGKWKGGNTITAFKDVDGMTRDFSDRYEVETVSLTDLLLQGDAPEFIDFLSVDTEGSEYEILRTFDFARFRIGLMVVEHNKVAQKREAIRALMERNGYRRLPLDDSITVHDDWYGDEAMCETVRRSGMAMACLTD